MGFYFYLGISHILEPLILKVLKFNELNVSFFFFNILTFRDPISHYLSLVLKLS